MLRSFVLILVLALMGGGCADASNTVTDGDRQVVHQSAQALALAAVEIGNVTSALGAAGLPTSSPAIIASAKVTALILDSKENVDQLAKNFGPPKEPKAYSPEAAAAARKQSAEEHNAAPWWKVGLWGLGGVLVTWLSTKVPVLGPIVQSLFASLYKKALNQSVQTTAELRKEGLIPEEALKRVAAKVQPEGPVHDLIVNTAHRIEENVLGAKL